MLRKLISKKVKQLKGETYTINATIPISYLINLGFTKFFHRLYGMTRLLTYKSAYISPSTVIKAASQLHFSRRLSIGRNCYIDALGHEGIKCGSNVSFGQNTTMVVTGSLRYLGKGIKIGDNVGLGTHGYYGGAGGLEIGNDTIIGNFVSMHPENHNYSDPNIQIRLQGVNHKGIKIGCNCWIGAKATILDGTVLGNGCIVAAGAVVSGKFPDNAIIGGVPAKILKYRC